MVFVTDRWIEADGARVSVRVWGEETGRDVLYWHGVSLTSHALADLAATLMDALELERPAFMASRAAATSAVTLPPVTRRGWPRSSYLERNERLARTLDRPSVSPQVVAAIEHGIAQAQPSATRPALAASALPVLLVTDVNAPGQDLLELAAAVPQAEIHRMENTGHDVLKRGGPPLVRLAGDWIETRLS